MNQETLGILLFIALVIGLMVADQHRQVKVVTCSDQEGVTTYVGRDYPHPSTKFGECLEEIKKNREYLEMKRSMRNAKR